MRTTNEGILIRGKGYTLHNCQRCEEEFMGRLNAKFCSTRCKNNFNNTITRGKSLATKKYLKIIEKNYNILNTLLEENINEVKHIELIRKGYKTKYFTSQETYTYLNNSYQSDLCCDLALIPINNETYKIHKHGTI